MPRIRRIKDYDTIKPSEFEEEDSDLSIGEFRDTSNREYWDERGWYSRSNIISSLSDAKIKTAILYHKETLVTLEAELAARVTGLKRHINKDGSFFIKGFRNITGDTETYYGIRGYNNTKSTQRSTRNGQTNKSVKAIVKKLKLSPKKQCELLKIWQEILDNDSSKIA